MERLSGFITIQKENLFAASPLIVGAMVLSFVSPPIAVFVGICAGVVLKVRAHTPERTVPIKKAVEAVKYVEPTRPEPVWSPPPEPVPEVPKESEDGLVSVTVTAVAKKKKPRPPFIPVEPLGPSIKKPVKKH